VCVILAIGDDDRFLLIKPSLRIAVELAVAVVAVAIAGTELVTIDLTSEDEAGMGGKGMEEGLDSLVQGSLARLELRGLDVAQHFWGAFGDAVEYVVEDSTCHRIS